MKTPLIKSESRRQNVAELQIVFGGGNPALFINSPRRLFQKQIYFTTSILSKTTMSSPKEDKEPKRDAELKQEEGKAKQGDKEVPTLEEEKEKKDQDGSNDAATNSKWTAVWDNNAQAYYWWNTETNETTWINPESAGGEEYTAANAGVPVAVADSSNPLDFLLDRIDAVVKKKLDNGEEVHEEELDHSRYLTHNGDQQHQHQQHYGEYYGQTEQEQADGSYTATAHFNARTGRFTTQEDVNRLNPENLTIESRAKRQMQFYFDVDSYTEERNNAKLQAQDGRVGKKKQLTRKEVEYFKKMKKEKKSKKAREWLMQ